MLRETAFRTPPIKELAVVGPDGQTYCTDLGIPLGARQLMNQRKAGSPGETIIEVIRLVQRDEQLLRVRRVDAHGGGLAALIPANLLMPLSSSGGGEFSAYVHIATADGTPVAQSGPALADDRQAGDFFVGQEQSARYGISVTVTEPKVRTSAEQSNLSGIKWVVTGVLAAVLIGVGVFAPWWQRENPVAELERALDAGEFVPYYQPVVDVKSGHIVGAEVLARWRKPDGTIISPGAFIPLIEQRGLIMAMTRSLMTRVRDEAGRAIGTRSRLKISFNLAAQHFDDDAIVEEIRGLFANSPIHLSQVVLEVTERQPLDNLASTRRVIAALQGLGCKVALDDVGTGHNGLSHILKLGVDVIKIDKMFVDAIGHERSSASIIETLIDLAQNMRMDIVAEGVENFDQVVYLRDHGVRAAQGFVFSPPLPGASFLALLESVDPLAGEEAFDDAATVAQGLARRRVTAA